MRTRARIATLVTASLLLAAPAAGAQTIGAPTNGQEFGCVNPSNPGTFRCGQSFVAPLGASLMESFTYTLRSAHALSFELYAYASPNVLAPALFTQALGPTAGADFQTFVFTPAGGVAVTGGASYVAVIGIGAGEEVFFQANGTGPYADGAALACSANEFPPTCVGILDYDLAFSATFASAMTPVPEPATLALTGGGLLMVGAFASRRRRAVA